MKKAIILVLVIVVLGAAIWTLKQTNPKEEIINKSVGEINFSKPGYIRDQEPEGANSGMHLLYEEPGAPALLAELVFDKDSMCDITGRNVNCFLLSSIMETTIGDRRVRVDGVKNGDKILVRSIALDREAQKLFGFVRDVRRNDQNVLIDIDEVEFLSGQTAIKAGLEDTVCEVENLSDCIPSLNNDFYIRNKDKTVQTYIADPNTKIQIFKHPGSPELEDAALDTFVSKFKEAQSFITAYPFQFTLDGAVLTSLTEQYIP